MKGNSCFFKMTLMWGLLTLQANGMTQEERYQLKERTLEMFNHAYKSYMDHAYPADELMPLSCKGRYRGSEPSRGDVDESLGNFSLSLVDSLDTLIVLGNFAEFEKAVKLVIKDVAFDTDVIVSVFETNIRILGGLIGGHVFSEWLRDSYGRMKWYSDELLTMAKDIGDRLLPAFNTTSGVPYPRINLKTGLKNLPKVDRETCTACAGTMVLEFAALSRLTGNPIYEEKAHKAMEFLWQQRHRTSHLMGTVFNVHNGEWVRRDSGVGAGIDSYYEYLLKAYILLGDETYLERFDKHYNAIMKYVSQGPMLLDVHMHRPNTAAKNFMNSLLAFWPGLQVLFGDIKPAIETHEMLYQVMRRHKFLPEAFTTEFKVYWGQHPLRPEFIESTYFIYKATGDPYYLDVGKDVLDHLENYARVPCGFAGVKDVRTGSHEDRMDSFVLAELFKYLYLLFAEKDDLLIDVDNYIFTTEAHLIPLNLPKSMLNASFIVPGEYDTFQEEELDDFEETNKYSHQMYRRTCPNTRNVFSGNVNYAHQVREPLKDMVENQCPKPKQMKRKLRASEFEAGNENHMLLLQRMGIHMVALKDGRVQLMHTASQAASSEEAEEGLLFMQEMIELSNSQNQQIDQQPRIVQFISPPYEGRVVLTAGPAQFGFDLQGTKGLKGAVVVAEPFKACTPIKNMPELSGTIAVVERGDCMFIEKARNLMHAGAIGGIVIDSNEGTSSSTSPMFAMSGDGSKDVNIPLVFLFHAEGQILLHSLQTHSHLEVYMTDSLQSTKSRAQESENNDVSSEADGVTVQMIDLNEEGSRFIHTEKTYKLFPDNDAIKDYIPEDNIHIHVRHTDLSTDIRFMHIHVEEAYTDNCMTNTVTQQVRTNIEQSGKIQSIINIERNADNVRRIHFKMFDVTRKFVKSNLFQNEKQGKEKEEMQTLEKFQLILEMQDKVETYTNIANLPDQRDHLVALIRLFDVILGGDKVLTHTHQESIIDFIKNAKPMGVYPDVPAHLKEQQSDSELSKVKTSGKGNGLVQNVGSTEHESEVTYDTVHQDIETILKTHKDDLPSDQDGKIHFKIMVQPGVEETVSVKLGKDMNKVFDEMKDAVLEKLSDVVNENENSVSDDQPNDHQQTDSSNQKDEL